MTGSEFKLRQHPPNDRFDLPGDIGYESRRPLQEAVPRPRTRVERLASASAKEAASMHDIVMAGDTPIFETGARPGRLARAGG